MDCGIFNVPVSGFCLIYIIVFSDVLLWNLHRILTTKKYGEGVGEGGECTKLAHNTHPSMW